MHGENGLDAHWVHVVKALAWVGIALVLHVLVDDFA